MTALAAIRKAALWTRLRMTAVFSPFPLCGSRRRMGAVHRLLSFSSASLAFALPLPRGFFLFLALPFLCAVCNGVRAFELVPYIGLPVARGYFSGAFLFGREHWRLEQVPENLKRLPDQVQAHRHGLENGCWSSEEIVFRATGAFACCVFDVGGSLKPDSLPIGGALLRPLVRSLDRGFDPLQLVGIAEGIYKFLGKRLVELVNAAARVCGFTVAPVFKARLGYDDDFAFFEAR